MFKNSFFSLKNKVLIFSIALMIIPLVSLGIIAYTKSSEIIKQKVSLSNYYTVSQIGNNIELITRDIRDTSLYLIQDKDVRDFLKMSGSEPGDVIGMQKERVSETLKQLMISKPLIYSTYLKSYQGMSIDEKGVNNKIDKETEKRVLDLKGGYIWTYNTIIDYYNKPIQVFSLIRAFNDINNITNKLGILKIDLRMDAIYNSFKNNTIGKQGEFLIVDNGSRILSSLDEEKLGSILPEELILKNGYPEKSGYFEQQINGEEFVVTYYCIENTDLKLINLVPIKELLKENLFIQKAMLLTSLVSIIVCIALAFLVSSRVLSPLKQMRTLMKKLEREDFDVYIEPKGNDEITLLSKSFNKMSAKLKEVINLVYSAQLKQKEAELKALQEQVNPHFLYNTLDTIYWMSRMEHAFETGKIIEALSKLFRLSLNSGKDITSVKSEVEHLKNYMVIQQVRYEDMIEFKLSVDEAVLDCKTIKLVLQPLVENAIHHGIEKKGEKGIIEVTVSTDGNNLIYTVKDDGLGIDMEEINTLLKNVSDSNRGFAIKNVNDRIKLYFGDSFGLSFRNEDPGCRVTVVQPLMKGDMRNDQLNDCG
ncbi:MAG: sensor histidine kinase [Clostridia bacterium]|nr:sensor histidine kinase [Clostridia bacterium]